MNFVHLGEVVQIRGGGTPDKSNPSYWGGDIPWASVKDFKGVSIAETVDSITSEGVANSATQIIPAGNIIVPTRMAVGKAAINQIDLAINQDLKALIPSSVVDRQYVFHAILANSKTLEDQATGATVKGIKLDALRSLKIPLPPLDEQRRIAGILDQADALRLLRARALDKLNTLGQAIFHEMFGDVARNSKGLEKGRVGDLCHRVSVGVVIKPASYYQPAGVPAIRGTNIKQDGIDQTELVYFSEEASSGPLKKSIIKAGDVLAVRSGRPGLAAVVPSELDGANCIDVLIATPNTEEILPEYLRDFLNSPDGRNLVLSNSVGQVQKHFNVKSLANAEIPIPSISIQNEYVARIKFLGSHKTAHRQHMRSLETAFTSLQHRAFRGEL